MEPVSSMYIKALLKLKSPNEGGRKSAIRNGYRPNHVFEYVDGQILSTYIGEIQFDHIAAIEPGTAAEVVVRFLYVSQIDKYLVPGTVWWIHEGGRLVGEAVLIELLPKGYNPVS